MTATEVIFDYLNRDGEWVHDYSLARYLLFGEHGYREISEAQAEVLALRLTDKELPR